jgi:serine/threonine protein kinase
LSRIGAGMPLHPATRLGPYEIVAFIGAGGMGEVYRARDKTPATGIRRYPIRLTEEDPTSKPERHHSRMRSERIIAALLGCCQVIASFRCISSKEMPFVSG